jgi:glycosyltransferase involved in cell wall biosynthesis
MQDRQYEELQAGTDSPLPRQVVVGPGTALPLSGWCYHPGGCVRRVELLLGERVYPADFHALAPPGCLDRPPVRPAGRALWTAFAAVLDIPACPRPTTCELVVRATLADGSRPARLLGRIALEPDLGIAPLTPAAPADGASGPLVAVCMATFNPPPDLFRRQVDSIRAQTHRNWVCVISDDGSSPESFRRLIEVIGGDPRFVVRRSAANVGFYANFERCMALAPAQAEFIALADQDDYWYPDKLATLLGEFDADTLLVYSDMRIVDANGVCRAATYWTTRRNQCERLDRLLLANTITGAASLFRSSLREALLPLPVPSRAAFHDQWLGGVALALGRVKFVDRPLYDYVQHQGNVVGHWAPQKLSARARVGHFLGWWRPQGWRARWLEYLHVGRRRYLADVQQMRQFARVLGLRVGARLTPEKRRQLGHVAALAPSAGGLAWLLRLGFENLLGVGAGAGREAVVLNALTWQALARLRTWAVLARGRLGRFWSRVLRRPTPVPVRAGRDRPAVLPLVLAPSAAAPPRVNVLVSAADLGPRYRAGLAACQLARAVAEQGARVRLVLVDRGADGPESWWQGLQGHGRVETLDARARAAAVPVSPRDVFVATGWRTAHLAHRACRDLGRGRFLYLIDEYEPGRHPDGERHVRAAASYALPHVAVFTTRFIRDFFRQHRLGPFAEGTAAGERDSVALDCPVVAGGVTAAALAGRRPRRLLLHVRRDRPGLRRLSEVGLLALARAVKGRCFEGSWELHALGPCRSPGRLRLAPGLTLDVLPRRGPEDYGEMLRGCDLGLSLTCAAHPSLVPLEMAAAGLVTVTNTFADTTRERLRELSPNFVPAEPTVETVCAALWRAADAVEDLDQRVRGARVSWNTRWEQTFNQEALGRVRQLLRACASDEAPAESLALLRERAA